MNKGVSVIVCCYNSQNRIAETVKHIALQQVSPQIPWEVIIVNNNSTDNTAEKARESWHLCKHSETDKFQIVDQPVSGLSYAREKGISTARYEYLLFCDDDNWLSPNYVNDVFNIFEKDDKIAAVGGKGIPEYEVEPHPYIRKHPGPYAVGPQKEQEGYLSSLHTLYGAGSAYRKSALKKLEENGFRFFLTGRLGNKLTNGEDRELGYAISLAGWKAYYSDRITFIHYIASPRCKLHKYFKTLLGSTRSFFILMAYSIMVQEKYQNRKKYKSYFIYNFLTFQLVFLKSLFKSHDPTPFFFKLKSHFIASYQWVLHKKKFYQVLHSIRSNNYFS